MKGIYKQLKMLELKSKAVVGREHTAPQFDEAS